MERKDVPILELAPGALGRRFLSVRRGSSSYYCLLTRTCLPDDEASFTNIVDELRCAALLNHPNVELIFEIGIDEGGRFMASEYVDGLSLAAIFERGGRSIGTPTYLQVLSDMLAALHCAHESRDDKGRLAGVVHGDLTPECVAVTYRGETKLTGFGGAKARDARRRQPSDAPPASEPSDWFVARREAELTATLGSTPAADIFAVGTLLLRVLSGRYRETKANVLESIEASHFFGRV